MDEPLSNLDAKLLRLEMRAELKSVLQGDSRSTTTIYVTHDQVEAMGLADRVAVMNRRASIHPDTTRPMQIYQHPASTSSSPASSARRR